MRDSEDNVLSAEDAVRVWRLSSQLQAEATGRIAKAGVPGGHDDRPSGGYALAQVRSAAREAGIEDTFLESALAELRAWQMLSSVGRGHRLAWRLLGDPPDLIVTRREINASVDEVVAAMQAVLPSEPFRLRLRDRQGEPQGGGALLFDLPDMTTPFERGFAYETMEAGLRQIVVSLRLLEGPGRPCQIVVHSAMTRHNTGSALGVVAAAVAGFLGFGAFAAVGVAVAGAVGLPAWSAAIAGVGGGLLGGVAGLKGVQSVYRLAVRRARGALEGLVGAVASRAEGIW
jgi:hypothetical protein